MNVSKEAAISTLPVKPHFAEAAGNESRSKILSFIGPSAAAAMISAIAIVHYIYLVTDAPQRLICFVPDDAFYELELARHFLQTGIWSFDEGITTTTGFHLFNVYLMSLFPGSLADPLSAIRIWAGIGVVLFVFTSLIVCNFASRTFGAIALVPVFLILTARFATLGTISLLEFPFVLLAAALYTDLLLRDRDPPASKRLLEIAALGVVGSLARSDFGGLPLVFATACIARWLWSGRHDYLSQSLYGLVGAATGLLIVFLHNLAFSGHALSGSAAVKALWGHRLGYHPTLALAVSALVSSPSELAYLIGFPLVGAIVYGAIRTLSTRTPAEPDVSEVRLHRDTAFLASVGAITILLYVLVYGFDPAAQLWYVANFILPSVLLCGSAAQLLSHRPTMEISGGVAVLVILVPHLAASYQAPWEAQRHMYDMSLYLQKNPIKGQLAGWNVGIVGYFLDGRVINLDGLMNNAVIPYIREAAVERYIDDMHISGIVDFANQISDPRIAITEGYDPHRLGKRLVLLHTETSDTSDPEWRNYTLYAVTPDGSQAP